MEGSPSHCVLCDRTDSADNLVQCDKCDAHVHFSCAGVNDSISDPDRSFVCRKCARKDEIATVTSRRSSHGTHTSRRSSQIALRLKLLEEESFMRMKRLEEEERFRKLRLDDEEKYRRLRLEEEEKSRMERIALLDAELTGDDGRSSIKSGVSSKVIRDNTMKWVGTGGQTGDVKTVTQKLLSLSLGHIPSDQVMVTNLMKFGLSGRSKSIQEVPISSTPNLPGSKQPFVPDVPLKPVNAQQVESKEKAQLVLPAGFQQPLVPNVPLPPASPVGFQQPQGSNIPALSFILPGSDQPHLSNVALQPVVPPGSQALGSNIPLQTAHGSQEQPLGSNSRLQTAHGSIHPLCSSVPMQPVLPPVSQQSLVSNVPPQHVIQPCSQQSFVFGAPGQSSFPHGTQQTVVPNAPLRSTYLHGSHQPLMQCIPLAPVSQQGYVQPNASTFFTGISSAHIASRNPEQTILRSVEVELPTGDEAVASTSRAMQGNVSSSHSSVSVQPAVQPRWPIGSGSPEPVTALSYGPGQINVGPTAAQIAARHVMARDLPVFAGDPQEWPMFYSCFRTSTEACGYNSAENLARLQRCLRGHALDSVRSRLLIPESVPHVIATLQRLYGRPEILIHALLKQTRSVAPPKGDDLRTLIKFGMSVQNLVDHMIMADQQQHLSNPMMLYEMVEKLPPNLKLQWAYHKRSLTNVNLATFSEFMEELVTMASEVTLHVDCYQLKHEKGKRDKQVNEKLFVHHEDTDNLNSKEETEEDEPTPRSIPSTKACSYCGCCEHQIAQCASFKKLDIDGRWKAIRQKALCRLCLVPHRSWPCRSKRECGVANCRLRHNMLLHSPTPNQRSNIASLGSTSKTVGNPEDIVQQHHHSVSHGTLLRYLPVTLYGNGKKIDIFALLDDGSTSTFLEAEVADLLGIVGPTEPLCLCWTGDVTRVEAKSQRIQLKISGAGLQSQFPLLNVRTVEQLKLPSQTIAYEKLSKVYPQFKELPIQSYSDAVPRLIIGSDNVELTSTLKLREGGTGELVATKTRLGWCTHGRYSETESVTEHLNSHTVRSIDNTELHNLIKQFFAIEEACVSSKPEAEEVKKALNILESSIMRVSTGFEVGLLWKDEQFEMPNSYPMAVRRLKCLEKRLSRDPELEQKVRELVMSYQEKGYAHRASKAEIENVDPHRTWYLPLGVVRNPKKPTKIRLVWDAAAKVNGVSFNDLLLTGPDLTASLVTVLLRFRQRSIAIGEDLREMFHQIKIREPDRQAQRFLWRDSPGEQPQVYIMDVATFGATCSPSIAQFVKNRNAEEFSEQYPRAANAIVENHYVDDFLDSVDTVDEAVLLTKQVEYIHAQGGFEIRNFISNSAEVLSRLGEFQCLQNKSLNLDSDSERVLGMQWVPLSDKFTFNMTANLDVLQKSDQKVPTKRQVLRTIMSVFDPLGLIAHFIIYGKVLMQDIWRSGTDWDEEIPEHLRDRWNSWREYLGHLGEVQIPRCIRETSQDSSSFSELHAFVDASELAYSCAIYLRTMSDAGVQCRLVAAKSKVAPLKSLSIPRMELQAALIGARLMESVIKSLTIPIVRRVFWTDSATVLAWLRSESRRYHQYVAFRIEEILSTTNISEWRHVPSKHNVADEATKWGAGPDFSPDSRWFNGPAFLCKPEPFWPNNPEPDETTTEEVRRLLVHHETVSEPLIDPSRFSNWTRMVRAVAYVIRALKLFSSNNPDPDCQEILSREELTEAENMLWKQAQKETYQTEYATLQSNCDGEPWRTVDKSSQLYQLSPFLDEAGVIRMGGRIGSAPFTPYEAKFPIILPKKHRITFLLADSYHRKSLHANNETVVNDLRQRFHVSCLRRLVRKVTAECQQCKVSKAVPRFPMMAPLPKARLTPFIRPFSYVGVDYFGPMLVKIGRSLVKRWIALFTCLTVRAVHLEVVHSLSTPSCVMAFRRFVARRGAPLEVYSDNGTCFVGANRQLKEEIKEIHKNCAATFTNTRTKWIFNPPSAPHMGGLWERMVRSVKTSMLALADGVHHPNEETLETFVLEAEGIVNSRPLTYVPLEAADQEALTPNHFLLYGVQGVNQPAVSAIDYRGSLRDSWKLSRFMADEFWRRWIREYLPTLTRRSKWFEPVEPLKPGDLVIVVDDGATRNQWMRGRILDVFPGNDGQVRKAKVQTTRGPIMRPAVKLAVLDVGDSGSPKSHGPGNVAATPGSPQWV